MISRWVEMPGSAASFNPSVSSGQQSSMLFNVISFVPAFETQPHDQDTKPRLGSMNRNLPCQSCHGWSWMIYAPSHRELDPMFNDRN